MKALLDDYLEGKAVLILGLGKEGRSTYRLIRENFPHKPINIADKDEEKKNLISNDPNVTFISGPGYLDQLDIFDVIFKSPGISLKELDRTSLAKKITSQTDLFIQQYHKQITGITGTKGKSTTASLLYHIIKQQTDNTILVGNIGVPPFDSLGQIDKDTRIVMELSAHQLEFIRKAPAIGILLNLYQEHLDHFDSFEQYKHSKFNIAQNQEKDDVFIFNADDPSITEGVSRLNIPSRQLPYSLLKEPGTACHSDNSKPVYIHENESAVFSLEQNPTLNNAHNRLNAMAAITAAKSMTISDASIQKGLDTFKGLEHRMEYVGVFDGVHYYNDSIATIPEATLEAIKSVRNIETLILGGFDRGIDYSQLISFLESQNEIKNVIFTGDAGRRMMRQLDKQVNLNTYFSNDYKAIVKFAKANTNEGKSCLLSPAAASYDRFKNFEERGRLFKALVSSG